MSSSDTPTWGPLRSFGRIRSRTLKPRQAALFDSLLPTIAMPDPAEGPIDLQSLMPGAKEVWLEIGFGGGEHLAEQATRHPDALMIGCEPFLNGVGSALRHIDERGLKNVRLHADDARAIMAALPQSSPKRTALSAFVASLIGGLLCLHVFGVLGLMGIAGMSLSQAFKVTLAFVPGDFIKCILCAIIVHTVARGMPDWRFGGRQ